MRQSPSAQVEARERIFTLSFSSLWPLLVPALLCAPATWAAARHHRWLLIAAAVLLAAYAVLGVLSVGVAYVPAVPLLIVSVLASSPVRRRMEADKQRAVTRLRRSLLYNPGPGESHQRESAARWGMLGSQR